MLVIPAVVTHQLLLNKLTFPKRFQCLLYHQERRRPLIKTSGNGGLVEGAELVPVEHDKGFLGVI